MNHGVIGILMIFRSGIKGVIGILDEKESKEVATGVAAIKCAFETKILCLDNPPFKRGWGRPIPKMA